MKAALVALFCASWLTAASLHGTVRDPNGNPLAGITVELRQNSSVVQSTKSDDQGAYKFLNVSPGTFSIRAGSHAQTVQIDRDKELDFATDDLTDSIQFSNDTTFAVAGVTDNTNMGSHGSEVTQRSVENLAKATASLKTAQDTHAEAAENVGNPLAAVREYQQAVKSDPSEPNLFALGTELLAHGAYAPAQEVFARGVTTRMLLGEAAALYSLGEYTRSASLFFRATDLNPSDPIPYTVLAQAQTPEITTLPGYRERIARFARTQPANAQAHLLFGTMILNTDPVAAEAAFKRAVELDPKLAEAALQLGILKANSGDQSSAINFYRQAIAEQPDLAQAHYRLAAAYRKIGDFDDAQRETETFRELSTKQAAERDAQRAQMQRFIVTLKSQ